MPDVIVIGAGIAGLSTALALARSGFKVTIFEARSFIGGRATSYQIPGSDEWIDNCQHVLLGCCRYVLHFLQQLGSAEKLERYDTFYIALPDGAYTSMRVLPLPSPLHLIGFMKMPFLSLADKLDIARCLLALQKAWGSEPETLKQETMDEQLRKLGATERAKQYFWKPILVSAINEELNVMSAYYGAQVVAEALLHGKHALEFYVPRVPLRDLYQAGLLADQLKVQVLTRRPVTRLHVSQDRVCGIDVEGEVHRADYYVIAVNFDRVGRLSAELGIPPDLLNHSPITSVHFWFDRSITTLPHCMFLERTSQWMFNKADGNYLQIVISASKDLVRKNRREIASIVLEELAGLFPTARSARLKRVHVVKELKATFSATPESHEKRPGMRTRFKNLFLAGDWTATGWPGTMESAARSGYWVAKAICEAAQQNFAFEDLVTASPQ